MEGTTTLHECPVCHNNTMDDSGECHYAYCDEEQLDCPNCGGHMSQTGCIDCHGEHS